MGGGDHPDPLMVSYAWTPPGGKKDAWEGSGTMLGGGDVRTCLEGSIHRAHF